MIQLAAEDNSSPAHSAPVDPATVVVSVLDVWYAQVKHIESKISNTFSNVPDALFPSLGRVVAVTSIAAEMSVSDKVPHCLVNLRLPYVRLNNLLTGYVTRQRSWRSSNFQGFVPSHCLERVPHPRSLCKPGVEVRRAVTQRSTH